MARDARGAGSPQGETGGRPNGSRRRRSRRREAPPPRRAAARVAPEKRAAGARSGAAAAENAPPKPPRHRRRRRSAVAEPAPALDAAARFRGAVATTSRASSRKAARSLAAMLEPVESGADAVRRARSHEIAEVFTTLGQRRRILLRRRPPRARGAGRRCRPIRRAVERDAAAPERREGAPTSSRPTPATSASPIRNGATNPYFDFLAQAYVMTVALGRRSRRARRRARSAYARQGAVLSAPARRRAVAVQFPRHQSRTDARDARRERRESGARPENDGRGHRGRPRQSAHPPERRQPSSSSASIMAATPGKVVFRNELIELIQYAPTTPTVYKRPLLIVPPWINKFYVLDLNPEKSFIRWAVAQGLTVFVISWVNPDERHCQQGFRSLYARGDLRRAGGDRTGDRRDATSPAIGYCVGGTLLAVTLAYMARDRRQAHLQRDVLHHAGRFHRRRRPQDVRRRRAADGDREEDGRAPAISTASHMASAFNMLRPNDLIWSYFVNNYLKGKEPMAFDLLVWNSDSTRMPAANHSLLSAQLLSRKQSDAAAA